MGLLVLTDLLDTLAILGLQFEPMENFCLDQ